MRRGSRATRPFPNFLVIGAPRTGTSSFHYYLGQHPQVFMSQLKEPKYFEFAAAGRVDYEGPGDRDAHARCAITLPAYAGLFQGAGAAVAIGESSPVYLWSERAFQAIRQAMPNGRFIAILRDPAQRAYSAYLHMVQSKRESLGFNEALEQERSGMRDAWDPHWRYEALGYYYASLARYFSAFGKDRVLVHLYEDLESDPFGVLSRTFAFLGVDPAFIPDITQRGNVTAVQQSQFVHRMLVSRHWLKSALGALLGERLRGRVVAVLVKNNYRRPAVPSGQRAMLVARYRDDILRTQDLVHRDLSAWLCTSSP